MPFTHASIEIEDLLTEAERKHIIEAFRLFDVNGNGTLDHEELVCRISSLAHVQISPPLKEEFLGILKWRTIFPLWMPIIVILCWQRCAGYALGFGGDNFEKISVEVNSFISILFLVHTCRTSVKYARVKNQSIPTLYRVFCQQRIKLYGESVNFQCCCMRLSGDWVVPFPLHTTLRHLWFGSQHKPGNTFRSLLLTIFCTVLPENFICKRICIPSISSFTISFSKLNFLSVKTPLNYSVLQVLGDLGKQDINLEEFIRIMEGALTRLTQHC